MSNLFKSNYTKCNEKDTRFIDNNELISAKIQLIHESLRESLGDEESPGEEVLDEFSSGIQAETVDLLVSDVEDTQKAGDILEAAREEAEEILNEARAQAEKLVEEVVQKAKKEAYEIARKEAVVEADRIKKDVENLKIIQEEEYQKRLNEMEPLLVDAILKVFTRVTNVLSEDRKDMILHLVNSVMTKTELSRNFIIRVSKDDYNFLISSREKIYGALLKDANIEIIEDITMKRNQCIIETDGGIYDCSLDIQLENLIRDIKTLASLLD